MKNSNSANRKAYVDEAGHGGFVRGLVAENDDKLGLLVSVSFSNDKHDEAYNRLEPMFLEFCTAAPAGAKLHITDAFSAGNEEWRSVAESVRRSYVSALVEMDAKIIYAARRHAIARKQHEWMEASKQTKKIQTSISVPGIDRPSDDRVEDALMTMLALRLDAFAQDCDPRPIDLLFDETDDALMKRFNDAIEQTRNIGSGTTVVKGWDMNTKSQFTGSVSFGTDSLKDELSSQYIASASVAGKRNPLVFAADIVANYLSHHLNRLPPDQPLNAHSSVVGWELEPCVWGVDDNAIDDLI